MSKNALLVEEVAKHAKKKLHKIPHSIHVDLIISENRLFGVGRRGSEQQSVEISTFEESWLLLE